MKRLLLLGIILVQLLPSSYAQESNCFREATFGNVGICLPEIEGYTECYTYPMVKELADATEVGSNVVLGYYVNNQTYDNKDSIGYIQFDDYFKVYGTKEIRHYDAAYPDLLEIEKIMSQNFLNENWEKATLEFDKLELGMEIGVPTFIEKYNVNKESFTMVMIAKYKIEGREPFTMAGTMNGYLTNKRLVWMAYYLDYEGEETIQRLKDKTKVLLEKLIEAK